jgi:hypothetical protein
MKKILLSLAAVALFATSAEAGPPRRIAFRLTHPFAPIGSYSEGDGTWRRRFAKARPAGSSVPATHCGPEGTCPGRTCLGF